MVTIRLDRLDRLDRRLLQIARRARTLSEWQAEIQQLDLATVPNKPSNQRLTHWCQAVAAGDWDQFVRRLAWGGLTLDQAQLLVGCDAALPAQVVSLPAWITTLRTLIKTVQTDVAPFSDTPAVPFEELLHPIVTLAQQQLTATLSPPEQELLASGALNGAAQQLYTRLTEVSARPLLALFDEQRPAVAPADSNVHYRAFVAEMQTAGLLPLFEHYPVVARLVVTLIDQWVLHMSHLLQRLHLDLPALQQHFDLSGPVTRIVPGLSDVHHSGQTVTLFEWAAGQRIIYKPRSLKLDQAFQELLAWSNQKLEPAPFRLLTFLPRHDTNGDYSWMEYVAPQPCPDSAAVERFYRRTGRLLALLYLLGATDCHYENLIAHGEYPLLIDCETLLQPRPWPLSPMGEIPPIFETLLQTGLLPHWEVDPVTGQSYDPSALADPAHWRTRVRLPQWQHLNSDAMRLRSEWVALPPQTNAPMLDGAPVAAAAYRAQIETGFRELWPWLSDLAAHQEPLRSLLTQPVRFVFRPTAAYHALLRRSLHPDLLRSGLDRSIALERLGRALLQSTNHHESPEAWPLVAAEIAALEQLDVPHFTTAANSEQLDVELSSSTQIYRFIWSAAHGIWHRAKFDQAEVERQVSLLQGSFLLALPPETGEPVALASADPSPPLAPEAALAEARRLAYEIVAQGFTPMSLNYNISDAPGQIPTLLAWVAPVPMPTGPHYHYERLGPGLYSGHIGIALFLRAYATLANDIEIGAAADAALASLWSGILQQHQTMEWFADQVGIGSGVGLGSIVYGLTALHRTRSNEHTLKWAQLFAALITPARIAADQQLDVLGGASGALLGLLALHDITGAPELLDTARHCGDHLLAQQMRLAPGVAAWHTSAERPLTGFSHGAAGISYALLRLAAAVDDERYAAAAFAGFAYERQMYVPAAGNWRDLRQRSAEELPVFQVSWCHGATGIGLARLGSLAYVHDPQQRQLLLTEIEVALQTTLAQPVAGIDQLCCGVCGRIEFLLIAGQVLQRPELATAAAERVSQLVTRATQSGAYRHFANLPREVFHPGFFQGCAGIGYTLLRLIRPDALPATLLWR